MPIAWPPQVVGAPWQRAANLTSAKSLSVWNGAAPLNPNLAANDPGQPITWNTFGGPVFKDARTKNSSLGRLGSTYQAPISNAIINPANLPFTGEMLFDRESGFGAWRLSGTSRDSAGAALGLCSVFIFKRLNGAWVEVIETVSDANGAWSVSLMEQGPFWICEYLAGSPDKAGASVNTITPTRTN
jgi:hypothetical protein